MFRLMPDDKIVRLSKVKVHFNAVATCLIALAVLGLSSCGKTGQQAQGGKSNEHKSESVKEHEVASSAQSGESLVMGDTASYPKDMPFEQYPGSKVTLSLVKPEQSNVSVNLETADSPDKVVSYYKSWFDKNKWKLVQQTSTPGLATISGQSDKKQVSIMSVPGAGASEKTSIQITLSIGK
jgi:hypothetical protein